MDNFTTILSDEILNLVTVSFIWASDNGSSENGFVLI